MKRQNIPLLACPICHTPLEYDGPKSDPLATGVLCCSQCKLVFPIKNGIPHFIQYEELTGLNRRFSRLYDWFSWGYAGFLKAAFRIIGMSEETARREITDRLDPQGGRVLEVSIGPGNNLPYIVNRPDVGEVHGLDISIGQLNRCQSFIRRKNWDVDLSLGNAEQLPYRDEIFSGVLHVGGINFFNNQKAAIDEMIRVAKPGVRILISDETEKGARGYEKTLPGFKKSFEEGRRAVQPPIDLVPAGMIETRLWEVWKGWFYCLEFRKP